MVVHRSAAKRFMIFDYRKGDFVAIPGFGSSHQLVTRCTSFDHGRTFIRYSIKDNEVTTMIEIDRFYDRAEDLIYFSSLAKEQTGLCTQM